MTANQRFKQRFDYWLSASVAIAAALHFCAFAFWPTFVAGDAAFDVRELEAITLPPEVRIPPPPESIQRPAMPIVGDASIDEEITIAETVLEKSTLSNMPAPRTSAEESKDISMAPTLTPFDVRPRVLNRDAVVKSMERNYPSLLRQAGIGGTVEVWFFLDVDGTILNTQLKTSSGQAGLDEAAMMVADIMMFSPAENRGRPVQVWVSQEITFTAR
jgi:TonB family protein